MEIGTSTSAAQLTPAFLERLCEAYRHACDTFAGSGDSMWAIIDRARGDLHSALLAADLARLGDLLADPARTMLYYGVDDLFDHGEGTLSSDIRAAAALRDVRRLAARLGVVRLHNPEGGERYLPGSDPEYPDVEPLLDLIDNFLGTSLRFPNPFAGEGGLATSRGIATVRAIAAVYQAYRLREMASNDPGRAVLELGAGMGRTAHYARLMGLADYAIVDLPLGLIGQAVFLALVNGEASIRFAHEPERNDVVNLITPDQFAGDARHWRIVLNVDSMPEMDGAHAAAYFDRMRRDRALFLSINHEANRGSVNEMVPPRYKLSRNAYMLRAGYVEELYDFGRD